MGLKMAEIAEENLETDQIISSRKDSDLYATNQINISPDNELI